MGRINKGLLGGFSGKVGPVVGASWKGIEYLRSSAETNKKPASEAQLVQQHKFRVCSAFVNSMSPLLAISFDTTKQKQTGYNAAISHLLKNGCIGTHDECRISYPDALVSKSEMHNVLNPLATLASGNELVFSWTDNTGVGVTKASDQTILVAYCPTLNHTLYSIGSTTRSALVASLKLASFAGNALHIYLGFIAENRKHIANSVYLGEFVVE